MSFQPQSSHSLVYFSSASENTHRFVSKLDIPATRIPLRDPDGTFRVDTPYVLIVPTYGGGVTYSGRDTNYVPKRVIKFLNDKHNRSLIRAVIAAGNTNFGDSFCFAGDVISQKCAVPYLYRFELMGTPEDVVRVREGLEDFWEREVRRAAHTH
ncbi:class Ib ribonucleoside-diphosphate reductase assembly flavoprotein NrdI [Rhodococcus sp. IEGM 1401]|uniref:class Ib ribonucleoside-diphosphate reductase assembly flavoprotein NrdI n=1 Tax=unclassified Rhodococcus (in: high G+C Gram-positive bacteria) TaxID=192944 RepID=UPI0022B380DD|nr:MULTISPECIES: class Ib ribonucleoside-diphosphate reductase assembly flavoprotein NrdI [unclassified Rhodococcus (in: high G+C Gram-positive bacteria)]MCZ4559436.1 class Ib ribonucleoside-diphosphate reductase assembly flavoprotein NrdI [Rhodococcus sp. IEGM 1401]MDI9919611.1 class Ib ribonucleoside-diphosphate reductase assembly flavoprotein NrdI [Rhodococcus sp. IEGM 1372]MDI9925071.1 class Ib ribonucleoside-diphosphate reductase assembly flavoprotein NrdI [Rhodococcus sp. IEGM 1341]MDV803